MLGSAALRIEGPLAYIQTAGDRWPQDVESAAARIADADDVRCAILTVDAGAATNPAEGADAACRAIELLAVPVIACIESAADDMLLALALACDLRVAADGATFTVSSGGRGEVPGAGLTQRLPRLAGETVASRMLLAGYTLDARAAYASGLLNEVTASRETVVCAKGIANRIAEQGPIAVRYAKEAIRQGLDMPLEQALRYETDLTIILQTTYDRAEGVKAFLEKRSPKFEGR